MERLTFDEAVERAMARNPTVAQAASGILRAQSILQQSRATVRPRVDAALTTIVIDPVPSFDNNNINPRTQLFTNLSVSVPLLTPVGWAERNQAGDQVVVAERNRDEVRREIALATAQTYLQVIALKRVQELNERARDTARAHYDYSNERYEGGVGSRLNALRAQQELSTDETRVEAAGVAVRRAQEALGVLVAAEGPVDAADEPRFETPVEAATESGATPQTGTEDWLLRRPDVRLVAARQSAAERVVADSPRDYLPSVTGLFDPQILAPSGLFQPAQSWTARILFQVPVFDSGQRRGVARERQSELDSVRSERANLEREARSEFRIEREAVRSLERALASARAAAEQGAEVLRITDVAFRAGATTNIEVIDAQRVARDADTAVLIAEDALRRARLDLLVAVGRFPR